MYVTYDDTFRVPPTRWLGYSYIVFKLLHLDSQPDKPPPGDHAPRLVLPLVVTAVYVSGHALFHRYVASVDTAHYMMKHCHQGPRSFFVIVSVVESLLWDLLATLIFPYTIGLLTHELADSLLTSALIIPPPARRCSTTVLTLLSVPVLGVVGDSLADRLLGLLTREKFSLCPPPAHFTALLQDVLSRKDVITVIISGVFNYFGLK